MERLMSIVPYGIMYHISYDIMHHTASSCTNGIMSVSCVIRYHASYMTTWPYDTTWPSLKKSSVEDRWCCLQFTWIELVDVAASQGVILIGYINIDTDIVTKIYTWMPYPCCINWIPSHRIASHGIAWHVLKQQRWLRHTHRQRSQLRHRPCQLGPL